MSDRDIERLVERAASAHREVSPSGRVSTSPAWHDLGAREREEVARAGAAMRRIEAAASAAGLSAAGEAVMRRIRSGN